MSGVTATYVFSRTRRSLETPGTQLVSSDPAQFVRDLKSRPGKNICLLGGGELAQPLIAAGVVDEIGLNVHPILLGSGTPLFRDAGHRVRLELTESRTIDGGCVFMNYRVQHG
jgi:dihydrofolate reductase